MPPKRLLACALFLTTPACGAGVVTSEDVSPGEAAVIAVVIIVAFLFIAYVAMRGRK